MCIHDGDDLAFLASFIGYARAFYWVCHNVLLGMPERFIWVCQKYLCLYLLQNVIFLLTLQNVSSLQASSMLHGFSNILHVLFSRIHQRFMMSYIIYKYNLKNVSSRIYTTYIVCITHYFYVGFKTCYNFSKIQIYIMGNFKRFKQMLREDFVHLSVETFTHRVNTMYMFDVC